jgi:two-component system CheB/CheR fusion protein
MKYLLDNISIGTVFLNPQMQIRRYTREATQVYRLVSSDIGRPLADIKSDVEGADLLADARRVLETLTPCEREVRLTSGAWYLARLQPYRTLDQVVDGVVLTFSDISRRIAAEATMQSAGRLAESIIDTVREPLLVLDAELTVVSASRAYLREFVTTSEQTIGRRLYELGDHQWDLPALRELLGTILPRDLAFDNFRVDHIFPVIGQRQMLLNARRVVGASGQAPLILLALEVLKQAPSAE